MKRNNIFIQTSPSLDDLQAYKKRLPARNTRHIKPFVRHLCEMYEYLFLCKIFFEIM